MSSWLSKAVHGVGHLAEKAAPYVGLIPGVGTLAGGVIGGLGGLAAGDGLGGALKYGAEGAIGGYGGAALRGLSKGGQALAVGSSLLHGGSPSAPGGGDEGVNLDPNTGLEVMNGGDSGGWLRKAAGAITGGSGQTNPLMLGLAGAEGINSAYLGNKANNYASDALKTTTDSYNSRAGLRSAGIEGLLHPKAPDMSAMSTIQSRNPYSAPATPPPAAPSPSGFLATRIKQAA